jgi:hypothetical protein
MKSHWQRIKTAVRLSAAAVAVAVGCIGIWGAWNANLLSDAALVNSPWNGGDWPDNVMELRNMLCGFIVGGAFYTAWGFIKIRDWVLASPKVKRALWLLAILAWGLVCALVGFYGVMAGLRHDPAIALALLVVGVLGVTWAVFDLRRWRRAGSIA